jgi:hypothetical protein
MNFNAVAMGAIGHIPRVAAKIAPHDPAISPILKDFRAQRYHRESS